MKPAKRDNVHVGGKSRWYWPGRKYRIHPALDRPHFTVEVHISKNIRRMREAMIQQGFRRLAARAHAAEVEGHVVNRTHNRTGRLYHGRVVAHMFLNRDVLNTKRGNEIVAHECGHAAMAWARFCRADLTKMGGGDGTWNDRKSDGEELLCYAIGELTSQLVHVCNADRIWE